MQAAVRQPRGFHVSGEDVEVFTDGSCVNNGSAAARAGSGVWVASNDARNSAERVPYDEQTNQVAEIYAVIMAHRLTPPFAALHIVTDSKYVVNAMTKWLRRWEEIGWIGIRNAHILREAVAHLRTRTAPTTFRWIKGHTGIEGNEQADRLAAEGAEQPRQHLPRFLPPPARFLKDGAELARLTQKLAYKGIRTRKDSRAALKQRTTELIRKSGEAAEQLSGGNPPTLLLWKAIRADPIEKNTRDFLWKTLHAAHRVGRFWKHIPGYEDRAICTQCGLEDSLQHILCECEAPGASLAWTLARSLLNKRGVCLPRRMTVSHVLGSTMAQLSDADGKPAQAKARLLKIITTETAYFIWKLRCERVIQHADQPNYEFAALDIINRWHAMLDARLWRDQVRTNKRLCGKRARAPTVVRMTWSGLLANEQALPEEWESLPGVLVGRLSTNDVH
ncbi:ribonuclease H-like protein [Cubamyces sp. BRFM 1775]|nr:ribonuclease H-like protein [Cubamyces sp. BRFM 1775]